MVDCYSNTVEVILGILHYSMSFDWQIMMWSTQDRASAQSTQDGGLIQRLKAFGFDPMADFRALKDDRSGSRSRFNGG